MDGWIKYRIDPCNPDFLALLTFEASRSLPSIGVLKTFSRLHPIMEDTQLQVGLWNCCQEIAFGDGNRRKFWGVGPLICTFSSGDPHGISSQNLVILLKVKFQNNPSSKCSSSYVLWSLLAPPPRKACLHTQWSIYCRNSHGTFPWCTVQRIVFTSKDCILLC